ncbi:MAG: beta strand repeat-containing protein, partial [Roseiflexaceae bacterium]
IAGNTITARQMGIWMNLYAAEPFTIRDNSISAVNTGEFTKWYGVMLSTISTPQNMVNQVALPQVLTPERWALSNNSISGSGAASSTVGYGYWLWSVDNNQTSNGTANVGTISGGTVSNVDVGLFMHNVDTDAATNYGIARTGAHASIANVTMNVKTDGTGLQIKDSASWATANIAPLVAKRDVKLIVGSGVTVNGGANGLMLEEAFASVDTLSGMALNGQSGNYVKLINNAGTIDATAASFDGVTGTTGTVAQNMSIEDKISHKSDNAALGLVRVTAGNIYVTTQSGSIQRGVDIAAAGDVVTVGTGAYQENVVINKQIKLLGAGSSSAGTGITAADTSLPVISITGSGVDATNTLSVRGFNISGTSQSSGSDGIAIQPTNPAAHIAISDVAIANHGQAIHYRSGTLTDMSVRNVTLNQNNFGLRVASEVSGLNGLIIDDATMTNNTSSAVTVNPSGPSNPNITNFTITNSRFTNNSTAGVANQHDLSFYAFRGNATLRNVQLTAGNGSRANANAHGIVFTNAPNESVPAGNIVLDNVTIAGHVGKSALTFQYYSDVSGIQMSGVDLRSVVAPWGDLTVFTSAGTTLALNDTKLKSAATWSAGGIDATSAQFVTMGGTPLNRSVQADLFTMADQVGDAVDMAGIGLVRLVPNKVYVTTLSGSIQRGVNNALSGDTVYVQTGTYGESVSINSAITVMGAQQGIAGWDSARGTNETVLQGKLTVATNATVDGVTITKPSTATDTGTGMNFTGWDGISVVATNGAVIRNSVVKAYGAHGGFGGSGFVSMGAGGATFESSKVIAGAEYNAASDNRGVAAVEVKGSGNHIIRGNQLLVSTNSADAVNIYNGTVTVDDNRISGVDSGIVAFGGFTGLTVTNNTVSSYNDNGIRVFNHTGVNAASIAISSNTVNGANPLMVDTNTNLQYVIGTEAAAPLTTTKQLLAMLSGNSGISQMQAAYFVSWAPQSFSIDGTSVTGALVGSGSDDTLIATSGTNLLVPGAGNDTMSGGSGAQVVTYTGNYSSYTLGYIGNTVTISGPDGDDNVSGVETLQFADKRVHVVGSAVSSIYTQIDQGITAATTGDIVMVAAGTYADSVTVNKQVSIIGAGKTATIIEPASGASPAILVSGSGADATNRLVIRNLSINTPSHRDGTDGISIQPTSGVGGYITIDNVNVARHGQAVHVRTGSLTDVVIRNADLSNNSTGVRVASAVSAFNGFVLEDSVINNSRSGAYSVNPSGPGNAALTNFVIRNTTFANNSTLGVVNAHDISFFGYNGNATLENVTVSSGNGTQWNANSYAISFTNSSAGFAPAGNMVLNNVAVTGHVAKGALSFQYYNDVSNISLNNVDLQNVAAGWGDLIVHHAGSTAFNAGNTRLNTVAIWWTGGVNAENVAFAKADGTALDRNVMADGFVIADQVVDGLDAAGAGLVRYVSNKLYVTTNTFSAPSTLEGAFDRAVAVAREGETVVVQDGVPTKLTAAITKNITFDGFFTFRAANLPADASLGVAIIDSFMARKGN